MEFVGSSPDKKFENPEQELAFLRQEVLRHENNLALSKQEKPREDIIRSEVYKYEQTPKERLLTKAYTTSQHEAEAITLSLAPEAHDEKVAEFIYLLNEKGVKNTIDMVAAMDDIHLYDDFHRFLVEYIKEGFPVSGLKEKSPLWRELHMTLYEVVVPESSEDKKGLKELLSSMEQFYAGMLSAEEDKKNNYFTIEISVANHSNEFIFYCGVPDEKSSLFEKQILSIFPKAKIEPKKDDYNVYNEAGITLGSSAELQKHPALPIRYYDSYDYDPLNILLNSFSKINKDGEGAAVQLVIRPAGNTYTERYKKGLLKLEKGEKFKEVFTNSAMDEFGLAVSNLFNLKKERDADKEKQIDQITVDAVKTKVQSPIVETNIRLIASAENDAKANEILTDLESAFNQFSNTVGNSYSFARKEGRGLKTFLQEFTYRAFNDKDPLLLNIKELTTTLHFPATSALATSQVKLTKATSAPAPLDLPQEGTMLGINKYRNIETKAFLSAEDRLRHFYTIGQTGTGKTTILKNMITQDILAGHGVCMIDPHGSDIQDILAIIPKERYEDVIYFDPAYTERPMALNMLEYDRRFPEQKTFVVNELLSIFNKLFDMKVAGGPMFEQYFRNAVLLTIEDPDTGNTLLDVSRVLANKAFRDMKIANCKNPIVVQFWNEVASKAGGEASLANIVPYITSKFDNFLSNEIMRPIIAQEASSFNFREVMDNKKILLVNLSKGRLGDLNANLIGLILVGKILMAALSRVDSFGQKLAPFYLYIDEFQNITTDSIASILSEARKYSLSLNVAHQFIKQLDEKIKDAVFGNVGSLAVFRVGADDAEYLAKQFEPQFTAKDLMNIDNHNAYLKILANGRPIPAFNIETTRPPQGNKEQIDALKQLSYLKFGKERTGVEAAIMEKYRKEPAPFTK